MDTPEREVEELEEHSEEVGKHIEEARADFKRKADEGVPGAQGEAHADDPDGRDPSTQAEERTDGGT